MIAQAEILAVGTELLLGATLNTNTHFLAQKLSLLGISCRYHLTVGDNPERLRAQIDRSLERSDCLILTGGLGPTQDDITMQIAAEAAGVPLEFDPTSWERILEYFAHSKRLPSDSNKKQAYLPKGQTILPNNNGTAPGAIIACERGERTCYLILLPGPPREMTLMFEESVEAFLASQSPWSMTHRYLRLIGIGESDAERRVMDLIEQQTDTTIAPYAKDGEMMFRLTRRYARSHDPELEAQSAAEAQRDLDRVTEAVRERVGSFIYAIGERPLETLVSQTLLHHQLTFGFAESLTAGLCTAEAADHPGISAVFRGGIVAYQDSIKSSLLGVDPQLLERFSAVSAEVALAMAQGAQAALHCQYAVSLTGYAGPDAPEDGTPIGRTYIAVSGPHSTSVETFDFRGTRTKIRSAATLHAYNQLRLMLLQDGISMVSEEDARS